MQADETVQQVHESDTAHGLARWGIGSRGLTWLVLGLLTTSVLLGGQQQTDQDGALAAVADKPLGSLLLVALAVGFLGYAGYLVLTAAVGHRDRDGSARWVQRAGSAGKAVVYLGLAAQTGRFLLRGSGGGDQTSSRTAEVMARTGGRSLVGLVGLTLVVVGLGMTVRACRGEHSDTLEQFRMPSWLQRPAVWIGAVGLTGRGGVFVLVGGFLTSAAVTFDPDKAKGLDAALDTLAGQAYGRVLLALVVVGVLAYAVWSFLEAAFREL